MYLMDMKEKGSTSNALLGLLSIHPMSGYDIRQLIPWSIGHFWSESYGQIYPALKRMTAEGLVEKKTEQQVSRPDKHVYSLTEEGYRELCRWLEVPPAGPPVRRDELLLKLFFGVHVGREVSQSHVSAFIERHQRALAVYAGLVKQLQKEQADDPQLPFWLITLNRGRHESLAAVQWGLETLEELARLEAQAKHDEAVEDTDA